MSPRSWVKHQGSNTSSQDCYLLEAKQNNAGKVLNVAKKEKRSGETPHDPNICQVNRHAVFLFNRKKGKICNDVSACVSVTDEHPTHM